MTLEYSTPPTYEPPRGRPGVIAWFIAYCLLMAVIYVLAAVVGVFSITNPSMLDLTPDEGMAQGIALIVIGLPLTAAFGAAVMLPRRPWVWIYDLVLICIGLTSCCLWPATIPLLIFWIKPEARAFFGRTV